MSSQREQFRAQRLSQKRENLNIKGGMVFPFFLQTFSRQESSDRPVPLLVQVLCFIVMLLVKKRHLILLLRVPLLPPSLTYFSSPCSPEGNERPFSCRSSLRVRSVGDCSTSSRARSSSFPVLASSCPHSSFSSTASAEESNQFGRSSDGEEGSMQQTETECGKRRDRRESSSQMKEHDEVYFLHECVKSAHLFLYCFANLR